MRTSEQLRLRGVEAWHERVSGENAGDSLQRASRILLGRGDVTADAAEGFGALLAAEHAGDFLLHFKTAGSGLPINPFKVALLFFSSREDFCS